MSPEEILGLPEYKGYYHKVLDNGDTVRYPIMERMYVSECRPDDCIFVYDENGDAWESIHVESGWYKRRFFL